MANMLRTNREVDQNGNFRHYKGLKLLLNAKIMFRSIKKNRNNLTDKIFILFFVLIASYIIQEQLSKVIK